MDALARIIDANANRAREALRVMEDAARFGLNDAALSEAIKRLRHQLREALGALALDDLALAASRDTPGDVGTGIATEQEGRRRGLGDVAGAAAARLTEALRSIEEAAKACSPGGAGAFEAMRYEAYEVEKRLRLGLGGGRAAPWRLCVLVTESLCRLAWERVAEEAIAGGADCLQLREKAMDGAELLRRARLLVEIARAAPSRPAVIVNDRPDVALLAGADGVHVGQTDLPVEAVRALAGRRLLVGVSTHGVEQARSAIAAGADYCGVGPMFPTGTKNAGPVVGPALLRAYLSLPGAPAHLAIGGITAENAAALAGEGCRGVAASSFVCGSTDPRGAAARIVEALGGAALRPRVSAGAG